MNNKNEYYCNESDYLKLKEDKEYRVSTFKVITEVFGYTITNTALNKELSEISKIHKYSKIYSYICDNTSFLQKTMTKGFNSEYGKIKYFTAILRNNLKDYEHSSKPQVIRQSQMEVVTAKYNPRPRKKSLGKRMEEME